MAKQPKLKYKLKQFIDQLPRHVSMNDFIAALETHGINKATFYRDRAITIKSEKSIPSDRLDVYAALLNVTADELKNYSVNIKPIASRTVSPAAADVNHIKALTGLKSK